MVFSIVVNLCKFQIELRFLVSGERNFYITLKNVSGGQKVWDFSELSE